MTPESGATPVGDLPFELDAMASAIDIGNSSATATFTAACRLGDAM